MRKYFSDYVAARRNNKFIVPIGLSISPLASDAIYDECKESLCMLVLNTFNPLDDSGAPNYRLVGTAELCSTSDPNISSQISDHAKALASAGLLANRSRPANVGVSVPALFEHGLPSNFNPDYHMNLLYKSLDYLGNSLVDSGKKS